MKSSFLVRILVENTAAGRGLLGEHGLAYLIETGSHRILFDTGQGLVLKHNAQQLGICLENLDAVVLSHGHFDRAGGLMVVLDEECQATNLFLHPSALQPKFSKRGEIGSPIQDKESLEKQFRQLVWTDKLTEIVSGIYVTGTIPRVHPLEDTGGDFWQDSQHDRVDFLLDDQALFFAAREGLVVVLGCAHAGVINTLNYITQLTGKEKIYAVMGGMHLINASRDRLQATVETLINYDVQLIGANHCTGMTALAFLWHHLAGRCFSCHVGTRFEFGT
ncbi:MBL fold metallo-hydrolase [Oscillatoria salina]|uniref:MBL fold metallo-hydrolase n=1 Tax=Oscillatoria salina TaxID=331517 RepID=UPI0013B933A4|nr:MBL fold metallo-hydrolase [Oscillatoria salina]MBZ8179450.1 MBL fold metallo-hydrolase [Oscillatoria salina IIICB1]NET89109.1 MBL fold metallo-hydrolase [Kamptonema sp. SIO1D9]